MRVLVMAKSEIWKEQGHEHKQLRNERKNTCLQVMNMTYKTDTAWQRSDVANVGLNAVFSLCYFWGVLYPSG